MNSSIDKNTLLENIAKIHTTSMGVDRIKKNLKIEVNDVIDYLVKKIENPNSIVYKNGKNYYVEIDNMIITINSYSYTIITAHIKK